MLQSLFPRSRACDSRTHRPLPHGGALDRAVAAHGGAREEWLDLSTGINPCPFPLPALSPDLWHCLPTRAAMASLLRAARRAYGVPEGLDLVVAPGAQALIGLLPPLFERRGGRVAIVSPTYGEYAPAFSRAAWHVRPVSSPERGKNDAILIVANPNNPDGRSWKHELLALSERKRGTLIVDESFADVEPDLSIVPHLREPGSCLVLRSFGKFFGLAGLRLGFAIGAPALCARLRAILGPWPVSGPALAIGEAAFRDSAWQEETRARLARDFTQLRALATKAGLDFVGGASLFALFATDDALSIQARLARSRIWCRIFDYNPNWLRLGLPGSPAGWARLGKALTA